MYEQILHCLKQCNEKNPVSLIDTAKDILAKLTPSSVGGKIFEISQTNTSNTAVFRHVNNFLVSHTQQNRTNDDAQLEALEHDECDAFVILANSVHLCLLVCAQEIKEAEDTEQDGHEQPHDMATFSEFIQAEIAKFREIKKFITQTSQSVQQPSVLDDSAMTLLTILCKTLTTPKTQAKTNAQATITQQIINELDRISKGLQKQLISALISNKLETRPSVEQSEALRKIKEIVWNSPDDTNLAAEAVITEKISELLRTLQPTPLSTPKGKSGMPKETRQQLLQNQEYANRTAALAANVTAKMIFEKLRVLIVNHENEKNEDQKPMRLAELQLFINALKNTHEKTVVDSTSPEKTVIEWIKEKADESKYTDQQGQFEGTSKLIDKILCGPKKHPSVKNALEKLNILKGNINCGAPHNRESDETTDQFYFSLGNAEDVYTLTTAKKDPTPSSAEELMKASARSAAESMKEYMENNNPDEGLKRVSVDLLDLEEEKQDADEEQGPVANALTEDLLNFDSDCVQSAPTAEPKKPTTHKTFEHCVKVHNRQMTQESATAATRAYWTTFGPPPAPNPCNQDTEEEKLDTSEPDHVNGQTADPIDTADQRDSFNANDIFKNIYKSGESDPVEFDPVKIKRKLLNKISRHRKDDLANLKEYFRGKGLENHVTNIISEMNKIYGENPIDNADTKELRMLQKNCETSINAIYQNYCEFVEEQSHSKPPRHRRAETELYIGLFGASEGKNARDKQQEEETKKEESEEVFADCVNEAFASFKRQNKKPS